MFRPCEIVEWCLLGMACVAAAVVLVLLIAGLAGDLAIVRRWLRARERRRIRSQMRQ